MSRHPIGDYGLLSDCQSAALVSGAGSIDWYCVPRFDAPSVFGRLLDERAGHWSICPVGEYDARRRYLPGSLVLETQFDTPTGMVMVTDALLFDRGERHHEIGRGAPHVLARQIEVTRGAVTLEAEFAPRPEYGVVKPRLTEIDGGVVAHGGAPVLCLSGPAPVAITNSTARWQLEVVNGQRVGFALHASVSWRTAPELWNQRQIARRLDDTRKGWESWSEQHLSYDGPWADLVHQSGRVLRALSYQPTGGAIIAAPTTSLPESVGGSANWDYRYTWLRDASLTMRALWVAACPDEASDFVRWIVRAGGAAVRNGDPLQVVYGVGGEHDLTERELPHLTGWRDSRPVRVGNNAWNQSQLDMYGEILDAAHRLREQLEPLDPTMAEFFVAVADVASNLWEGPDRGIWESRGEPRHYLSSKLMCWVALDRAIDLAGWLGAEDSVERWEQEREKIRRAILEQGWSERAGAYSQAFGSDTLDASVLLMAITGFLPADNPRMSATIECIADRLSAPCSLLYRYLGPDDDPPAEGTFLICTYWLVQCLALAGEVDRAVDLFEQACAYVNDLGLLSEEAEPTTGELVGNFPQAFSHVGLVNAAWAISQAADRERQPSASENR